MHLYRPIIASLVIIFAVNQQAHASSDNLDSGMDNGIEGFQQGNSEGLSAGIADYPYRNSDCPVGRSTTYCLGWSGGYEIGFNAQKAIDESDKQIDKSENGEDDDD